jgi:hypothetical protein
MAKFLEKTLFFVVIPKFKMKYTFVTESIILAGNIILFIKIKTNQDNSIVYMGVNVLYSR